MEFLAIIKLISGVIGGVITMLTGVLLIRHRQLIDYFKGFFSFIRDDYQAEQEIQYGNIYSELVRVIKYGFNALGKSNSESVFGEDKATEINQILVLLGKLFIAAGILAIIFVTIGTIWMISESQINISLN